MHAHHLLKLKMFVFCFACIVMVSVNTTIGCQQTETLTDLRDGQTYRTVGIGTQVWMAENLNYVSPQSVVYGNDVKNARKYGRLYPITEAQNACPAGWHLPSDAEWQTLEKELGMPVGDLGKESTPRGDGIALRLKSKTGWDNNKQQESPPEQSGFSALPGGFYLAVEETFLELGTDAYFWTSTQENKSAQSQLFSTTDYRKEQFAWSRLLNGNHNHVARHYFSGIDNYYSVRCIKSKSSNKSKSIKQKTCCNGISVEIPYGWEFVETLDKTVFLKIEVPENKAYSFRPFVNFTKIQLNGNSIEGYYKAYMTSLQNNENFQFFKIISKTEVTIDGLKGIRFTYSAKIARLGTALQSTITLIASNEYRYSIDYTYPPDVLNEYKQQFEDIEQSVKFLH